MVGERVLSTLLNQMDPNRSRGSDVFCTTEKLVVPDGLRPVATMIEPEGTSVDDAERALESLRGLGDGRA